MSTQLDYTSRPYREPDTFGRGVWCGVLLALVMFACGWQW